MSRNALIIDAEPSMSQFLADILRPAGIEAIAIAKGCDALDRLQEEKFDVVFVDLGISSGTGIELTRKARSLGFNRMTPIILISGDRQRGVFSRGFDAGASFIVHKPVDRAHMIKLLRVAQGSVDQERRRFRRIALRTKIRINLANSEVVGETIDISLNGALVQAARTFPARSAVQVALFLPSSTKPVTGSGSVVRVLNGNQMGILLDGLPLAESGRLQDYLLPLLIGQEEAEIRK